MAMMGIEVTGASLQNGLLAIDLERPQVEPRVRSVKIRCGDEYVPRIIGVEE